MESLLSSKTPESLHHIINRTNNKFCADCNAPEPDWASLSFGIIVCLDCAGYHRSLGTHVTTVRSLKLDTWSDLHVKILDLGGNSTFRNFVQNYCDLNGILCDHVHLSTNKYLIPEVLFYREIFQAQLQGRDPTPFDKSFWQKLAEQIVASTGFTGAKVVCDSCRKHLNPAALSANTNDGNGSTSTWIPDNSTCECMICKRSFSLIVRRHHCRKCGRVICKNCAPFNNTRPIFELGYKDPVRHCRDCFRSPALRWQEVSNGNAATKGDT